MTELILKNANLGLTMHKVNWNGEDVVWGDDMRDALRWDKMSHMIRTIDEGKDYFKVELSCLKSIGLDLCPNLGKNTDGRGRPQKYAYLITRQGAMKLIATRRPHDIQDDPELAQWLDKLQDWIFGEVLPEVLATGSYVGKSIMAGHHAIENVPKTMGEALRFLADEYDAHELTIGELHRLEQDLDAVQMELDEAIKTKAQISSTREANVMGKLSALTRKIERLQSEINELRQLAQKYIDWIEHIKEGRWGEKNNNGLIMLF